MATINFSIPEDVKSAFNDAYAGQNKSAVITALMREAVERAARERESQAAIKRILARRRSAPVKTDAELAAARKAVRR